MASDVEGMSSQDVDVVVGELRAARTTWAANEAAQAAMPRKARGSAAPKTTAAALKGTGTLVPSLVDLGLAPKPEPKS